MQRIANLGTHGAFQWQWTLHSSVRKGRTSRRSQRTGYPKLALGGAPILLERSFNVDDHVILSSLRPMGMACPLLDLRAHLGYR